MSCKTKNTKPRETKLRLSIIIPVYNLEEYIEETIKSCLNQDVPSNEYEIICIDDGSKDGSVDIIKKLQKEYTNISLYSQQNSGVSVARNKGIELAKGNYIWFVDGDDLIAQNCLRGLLQRVEQYDADKVIFNVQRFIDSPNYQTEEKEFLICQDNEKMYEFCFRAGGGGVWCNLYKTQLIKSHGLSFNSQIKYSEDVLFDFQTLLNTNVCLKTENVYYFYRQRAGSAMHSGNMDNHVRSTHLLTDEYNSLIKEYTNRKDLIEHKRTLAVCSLLFSLFRKGDVALAKNILKDLKQKGYYPYKNDSKKFRVNKEKRKDLTKREKRNQKLIILISKNFNHSWYFMLCVRLSALKNKFKGKKKG